MKKVNPLKSGVVFGLLMFVVILGMEAYEIRGFNWKIVVSAFVGGLVGGGVYGGIDWIRYRNHPNK